MGNRGLYCCSDEIKPSVDEIQLSVGETQLSVDEIQLNVDEIEPIITVERMTAVVRSNTTNANAKVATALCSIPTSSDTMESGGPQMKQR